MESKKHELLQSTWNTAALGEPKKKPDTDRKQEYIDAVDRVEVSVIGKSDPGADKKGR